MNQKIKSFKETLNNYERQTVRGAKGSLNSTDSSMFCMQFERYCDGVLEFCADSEIAKLTKDSLNRVTKLNDQLNAELPSGYTVIAEKLGGVFIMYTWTLEHARKLVGKKVGAWGDVMTKDDVKDLKSLLLFCDMNLSSGLNPSYISKDGTSVVFDMYC